MRDRNGPGLEAVDRLLQVCRVPMRDRNDSTSDGPSGAASVCRVPMRDRNNTSPRFSRTSFTFVEYL